jgi:hypothetical protein
MAGRFFWASTSGLHRTQRDLFYLLHPRRHPLLLSAIHAPGQAEPVPLFVGIAAVVLHVRGGFATIPAYLKDLFGGFNVSAIHGRLLTAWSMAGIIGPLIVNGILDHYVENKLAKEDAYPLILHIMCGLLVVGFLANLMVRPVAGKFWLKDKNIVVPVGAAH